MVSFDDAVLDQARGQGDPPADALVAALFEGGHVASVGALKELCSKGGPARARLPPALRQYLDDPPALSGVDWRRLERGQAVFAEHAPEILWVLAFYSLPSAYAAKCGVQVLDRTGDLCQRPMQRLFDTARTVVGMLSPGALDRGGPGIRAVLEIRLLHAAVRRWLCSDRRRPWPEAWGVPINQEDLAGTLMTFSFLVLDGLAKLKVELTLEQREDYLYTWVTLGRLLGIRPELLPANVERAEELTRCIYRRQILESREGKRLTRALIEGMRGLAPGTWLDGFPAAMIRHFLERDPFGGLDVAELLGVPDADWTAHVVRAVVWVTAAGSAAGRRFAIWRRVRSARLGVIEGVLHAQHTVRQLRSRGPARWAGCPRGLAVAR